MPDLGRSILFSSSQKIYSTYSTAIREIETISNNSKLQDCILLQLYKQLGSGEYAKLLFANMFGCTQSLSNYMVDYIDSKYKKDKRYISWKIDKLTTKAKEEDNPKFDTIEKIHITDTTKQSLEFTTAISAEFETGADGWKRYLSLGFSKWGDNYIDSLKEANIKIEVAFLINKNGIIDSVSVDGNAGKDLIDKITNLFLSSPKWLPATKDEKPVAETKKEELLFRKND